MTTSRKKAVTVRIAGEEHVLRSTAEPDYTRSCAEFLDDRVRDIKALSGLSDTHRAVILAALSITDHYFQARDELEQLRKEVTARSTALSRRIEEEVGRASTPPT
jgi:cell division protein ZapA (FtsZ GTPase activity inhibitor)